MPMHTEHLKQRLEEEKTRLESEMGTVGRKSATVPGDWETAPSEGGAQADPIDQAEALATRDTDAAVLDALESRYDTIVAALARIANGTFGVCEECGESIAEARLEANPAATTCALHMR